MENKNNTLYVALIIGIVMGLLHYFQLNSELRFDVQFNSAEPYRLFTANFIHLTWLHLLSNIGALCLVCVCFNWKMNVCVFLIANVLLSLAVGIGLLFSESITRYSGYSGVNYGLFMFWAIVDLYHRSMIGWLVAVALLVSVSYEQFTNDIYSPMLEGVATVAIDAHLIGLFSGIILGVGYCTYIGFLIIAAEE